MPPEPLSSWDRKDFFKERKHERSDSVGGSVARWRDSPSSSSSSYHHNNYRPREFSRWGPTELRRPSGYSKQGGWHMFPEEQGNGYAPSRSSEKIYEEDKCRLNSRSGDGKYARRENRGSSYASKDWRNHSREISSGPRSRSPATGRHDVNTDQRQVGDMSVYYNETRSGFANGWDKNHFKDEHDKIVRVNGMGANKRYEQETNLGSINWKPLKWTRSGSMSSRGSGYSHSISPRSAGVDSGEVKAELQPTSLTRTRSPIGDAVACVSTAVPSDEAASRKKPRLGWGEGLAKYEKKKDGPDDGPNISGISSPRVSYYSDFPSPATPSSVACSSSPGTENRPCVQVSNTDNDISNITCSQGGASGQNRLEGLSLNLEILDTNTIASVGSYLTELLKSDENAAVDFNCVGSTAMNKLLVFKSDISKALETTECEIDSLENELKSFKSELGSSCSIPAVSKPVPVGGTEKPCNVKDVPSSLLPAPSEHIPTQDTLVQETPSSTMVVVHASLEANDEVHETSIDDMDCVASTSSKSAEDIDTAPKSDNLGLCTDMHDASVCDTIFASNRESARRSSEVFNKLLGEGKCQGDKLEDTNVSSCQKDRIRRSIARRMRFFRFKERVISLKFRAFQHLWEEDTRLLSIKKNSIKSHKRLELSSKLSYSVAQKYLSSTRSKFSSPARSLSIVPTTEMMNFASKLLSDPQFKLCRRISKMPALIMDKKERLISRLQCSNGLVEDPLAVEKERTMINPWTAEEKKIFMDKLAVFGKDFRKIASFIDHKTTADCVEFYYKNHKSDTFEKTKKPVEIGKHGKALSSRTYMLTSGKRWNPEPNVASLDILGAASVIAAQADVDEEIRNSGSRRLLSGCHSEDKTPKRDNDKLERPSDFDILENERETVAAADVLAGICSSLSSEAMSSCITSSIDPAEGYMDLKYKKVGSTRDRHLTPEVAQMLDDDETCSDESSEEMDSSDWTDGEKSLFIHAISTYGKDFARVSHQVGTRSRDQCKLFFSKARKCLRLDMLLPGTDNVGASDDAEGGGSDSGDACVVEAGSDIGSNKPDSKMEDDLHLLNKPTDESDIEEGAISLQTNPNTSEEVIVGLVKMNHAVLGDTETSVTDQCQLDNEERDFDNDNNIPDGVNHNHSTMETVNPCLPKSESLIHTMAEEPVNGYHNEGERTVTPLPEKGNADDGSSADTVDQMGSWVSIVPSQMDKAGPIVAENTTSCMTLTSHAGSNHHVPMEVDSDQNSFSISLQNSLPTEVSLADKPAVQFGKIFIEDGSSSTLGLDEIRKPQYRTSTSINGQVHSYRESQALTGYPFLATKKEVNADITGLKTSTDPILQMYLAQECVLKKSSNSTSQSSVSELSQHYSRSRSRSSSDPEKPSKNGDVKLFGQILSNPTSSVTQETDEKSTHRIKSCNNSVDLKFCKQQHTNIDDSKFDRHDYLGFENFAMRTYGFWDGNKIQTGLSTLPESVVLRAKHSPAFNNSPLQLPPPPSSSILEQSSLHTTLKNNANKFNGISMLPSREADYQMYRNLNGNKSQQLTQRHDVAYEKQRFNGFGGLPSLHQQGIGAVIGNAGILVSPPVSDPVAAFKMHYARAEQYVTPSKDELWRGDIGGGSR